MPELSDIFRDADRQLDARGLDCPEPVLRCRLTLNDMAPDETLHIVATDPHAELDFEVFAMRTGHPLEAQMATGGDYHFLIRKRSD